MAAITDIFKNPPIGVAIFTILFITLIFYVAGIPSSNYEQNVLNNITISVIPNEPTQVVNYATTPDFVVGPRDAIAYIVNYPDFRIPPMPGTPITTITNSFFTISKFTRDDYIAYRLYEYYARDLYINKSVQFNDIITGNLYILPDTQVILNETLSTSSDVVNGTTRKIATISDSFTVSKTPSTPMQYFTSVDVLNAFSIAPDAYEYYAAYENFVKQGSAIGFYKNYLRWPPQSENKSETFFVFNYYKYYLSNATDKVIETNSVTLFFATSVNGVSSAIVEYPYFITNHTLVGVQTMSGYVGTFSDKVRKVYYPIVSNAKSVSTILPSGIETTLTSIYTDIQSLASYYAFIENIWGVNAPSYVNLDYKTSYIIGTFVIPSYAVMSQLYYSYVDFFFSRTAFYNFTALDFEPWKGYMYAPDSVKSDYIYFMTLPPVHVPRTGYLLSGIMYTAARNFYLTTEVHVHVVHRGAFTVIIKTTSSIYNTGTMRAHITITIPFKYGELWKEFTVYLFETNPKTTETYVTKITGRYISSDIIVVFSNAIASFTKPTDTTTNITYGVGIVVKESYPAAPMPPIKGTNILIPQITTTSTTEFLEFYVSINGTNTKVSIPVVIFKEYATGFSSTDMNNSIISNVTVSLDTYVDERGSYITPTYTVSTLYYTYVDANGTTKSTPVTSFTMISNTPINLYPNLSFKYTITAFNVTFNLQSYLKEYKIFADTMSITITHYSISYDGANFVIYPNETYTSISDVITRNDFVTQAKVIVTFTYSVSNTVTTSTKIVTRSTVHYDPNLSRNVTTYNVYYTIYERTIYITTIPNVYFATGVFTPVDYNTSLGDTNASKIDTSMTNILASIATTQMRTLMFYGELLATKPILWGINLMPAEANNYINLAELKNQMYLGPFAKSNSFVLGIQRVFTYRSASQTSSNGSSTIIYNNYVTTVTYYTMIMLTYGKNFGYENSTKAIVFKAPRHPEELYKTIIEVNYPAAEISGVTSYNTVMMRTTIGSTIIYYKKYPSSIDNYASELLVGVLETYLPGEKAAVFSTIIDYTSSYVTITPSIVFSSITTTLDTVEIKVPAMNIYTESSAKWYPPIDYLVSSLEYGIAIPFQFTRLYYIMTSTLYFNSFINTTIVTYIKTVDKEITTYSVSGTSTTSYVSTSHSSMSIYFAVQTTSGAMIYTANEEVYPVYLVFALDPRAKETITSTHQSVDKTSTIYVTFTSHMFVDSRIAVPPFSLVEMTYILTSGTSTIVTSGKSPVQLFPLPVNTQASNGAEILYRVQVDAYNGTSSPTIVYGNTTITFVMGNFMEEMWFANGYVLKIETRHTFLPVMYAGKATNGLYMSFTTYTSTTVVTYTETYTTSSVSNGTTSYMLDSTTAVQTFTFITVAVDANDITSKSFTSVEVPVLTRDELYISSVIIYGSHPYVPVGFYVNNAAPYVYTLTGIVMAHMPFFYDMFIGHPVMHIDVDPILGRTYYVFRGVVNPEPYPFTITTFTPTLWETIS